MGFSYNSDEVRLACGVEHDGNCFFQANSFAVSGIEDSQDTVREAICEHMLGSITNLMENYCTLAWKAYIDEKAEIQPGHGLWM